MVANAEKLGIKIRRARASDAQPIAELTTQLGYPASRAQIAKRYRTLRPESQHAVFVAEIESKGVVGWLHVSFVPLLESDPKAEVNGLVVSAQQRSSGVGAKLLAAAEAWSKKKHCRAMNVRSNVIRDRAHSFYLRNGYEHYKTQKAFRKIWP
jgi:GNAT superfamily N-acetyltransferase